MGNTVSDDPGPGAGRAHPSEEGAPIISLTRKAVEMVTVAMRREGLADHGLRIGVAGGGCSGFHYHLAFEEKPGEDDAVFQCAGVTIFIDAASRPRLQGTTLDYVTGLHGAGFKLLNPNPPHACGCGSASAP